MKTFSGTAFSKCCCTLKLHINIVQKIMIALYFQLSMENLIRQFEQVVFGIFLFFSSLKNNK